MSDEKHVLIFSADWCGPCRLMKSFVWNNQSVKNALENFDSYKFIDIDSDDGKKFAFMYRVNAVPTVLIVDESGSPVKTANTMNAKQAVSFLDG